MTRGAQSIQSQALGKKCLRYTQIESSVLPLQRKLFGAVSMTQAHLSPAAAGITDYHALTVQSPLLSGYGFSLLTECLFHRLHVSQVKTRQYMPKKTPAICSFQTAIWLRW